MQVRIASDCGILIRLQLGKGSDRPKATWSRGESSLPVCAWAAPGLVITPSGHVFVTLSIHHVAPVHRSLANPSILPP